jgi:site-specific DNA recombinase
VTRPKRRAAKYKRISRDREGKALGIERQDQDLDDLAERNTLTVVADYSDNDLGASRSSKKPRPDYARMLADAKAGKFDVILAYTAGRLTRRPREFEDLIDLAVDHGIDFQYVRSPRFDLKTAQGRELARTMAARDAGEAEELGERVEREKRQTAEAGKWRGGPRPYGYGPVLGQDAQGRAIRNYNALVDDEADEIRNATREVLQGGSLRAIAADMSARGKVTSTGRPWNATELRKVLRRARNAGLVEVTQPDGSSEIVATAVWPAIVTESEWRAVITLFADPDRRTNKSNVARRWLGSGLYRCGVCGGTVRASSTSVRASGGTVNYRCHKKAQKGQTHVIRRADLADEVVEKEVLGYLSRPGVAAELVRRDQPDLDALRNEATVLRGQLDEVARQYATRTIDGRQLAIITKSIRAELDRIEAQIAASISTSPMTEILSSDDIFAAWAELDIPRRQAIVDAVCEVVLMPGRRGRPPGHRPGEPYFDPASVDIRWRRASR